jgi:CRP-like cAMP-binding protein
MPNTTLIEFFLSTKLMSAQKAEAIAMSFTEKTMSRGDYLLEQGKTANEYLFLESGFMRAFAYDTEGSDVTTNFYAQGQMVFEVSSFFNRIPSHENIRALTDCKGWYITYEQLNMLFHSMEEFREFGRHILVRGYAAYKTRMLSHIVSTAEERYAALLKSNPEIFQHAPLKHVASYLGITDTSLSRIRKEFSKK